MVGVWKLFDDDDGSRLSPLSVEAVPKESPVDVALDVVPNVKPEEEVVPEEEEVLVPNVKPEEEVVVEDEVPNVSPEDDVVEDESPNVIPVAF